MYSLILLISRGKKEASNLDPLVLDSRPQKPCRHLLNFLKRELYICTCIHVDACPYIYTHVSVYTCTNTHKYMQPLTHDM